MFKVEQCDDIWENEHKHSSRVEKVFNYLTGLYEAVDHSSDAIIKKEAAITHSDPDNAFLYSNVFTYSSEGNSTNIRPPTSTDFNVWNQDRSIYPCQSCSYKALSIAELEYHQSVHLTSKPYKCRECPFQTVSILYYESHKLKHKTHHNLYYCFHCKYKSSSKNFFKRHVLDHKKESLPFNSKYVCPKHKTRHSYTEHCQGCQYANIYNNI